MSTVLVDRIGRRPLLFYSCLGYGVSLSAVCIYFFMKEVIELSSDSVKIFGFIPFVGIIISSVVSTLGIVSLVFIIPGEIFPTNVKAVALSTLNIYGGFLAFLVAHIYQYLKDFSGLTGVFGVFATVTYFGAFFVHFYLPETRGKSLHEILDDLQSTHYSKVEVDNVVANITKEERKCTEEDDPINTETTKSHL